MKPIYYATYITWYDCPLIFICYDEDTKYLCCRVPYEPNEYAFGLFPISDEKLQEYINGKIYLGEFCNQFKTFMVGDYKSKNSDIKGDIEIIETIENEDYLVAAPGYPNDMGKDNIIIKKDLIIDEDWSGEIVEIKLNKSH